MSRDWCFTSWDTDKELCFDKDKVKYIVYGKERCPSTDREHYQGFAIFDRTCRIPKAKQWIGGGDSMHCESRRGSRVAARDYCRKDGVVFEWGELGARCLKDVIRLPIKDIKECDPLTYVRYHRGIEKLNANVGEMWREVKVEVLWGPTGCGKTRECMKEGTFKIDPPYTWWDGYAGEETLLIDDFRVGAITRGMLLNLLDGYRLRLETKGGHTWALWKKVYITTNFNPETWDDAILRRVTSVRALG